VKEFAKHFKRIAFNDYHDKYIMTSDCFDNLLKETVGDADG
jgi:hypothetical protein